MFSLQLLGGLSLSGSNGQPLGRATQRKRLALLAVLARAPRRTATRDRLIGLLWPECTDEEARHRLSSAIYDLRQTLGAEALISQGDDVSLASRLNVDSERFEAAAVAGRWSEATTLYQGPFLDGVHLDDAEEFERWVDGERDRLRRLWERARAAEAGDLPAAFVSPIPLEPAPAIPAGPPKTRGRPRWRTAAVAGVALAALLGWAFSWRSPANAPPETTRIAVFPFRVLGNASVPNLAHGVVDLLSLDLDGAGDVRVVDPDALLAGLSADADLAADAARIRARRFGATHYVLGTAQAEAGRIRLRATLYATGDAEIEAQVSADGASDHLLALVDRLAVALLADRLHTSKDRIAKAATVGTTSVPAIKAWLAGESAFRRGLYVQAAEAFERAATLDTTFALAHYRYSLATLWGDRPGASTDLHDAMAMRHAARLAPRDRQLLEAYAAWRAGDAKRAEYLYRRILATWPDDLEAWHQLGETLFHYNPLRGRPVSEARPAFDRVLGFDPEHRGARWHLALLDALAGRTEALRQALTQLTSSPEENAGSALELRALLAAVASPADPTAGDAILRAADEVTLSSLAWRLAVFVGDLSAAERTARSLLEPGRNDYAKLLGRSLLAQLALARGKRRAAVAEFSRVPFVGPGFDHTLTKAAVLTHWWAAGPNDRLVEVRDALLSVDPRFGEGIRMNRIYAAAVVDLALRNTERVSRAAAHLESAVSDSALTRDLALALRAYLALHGGQPEHALGLLDQIGAPGWFGYAISGGAPGADPQLRFVRAEALLALGRDEEASGWYGSFGEHATRDLAYLAPSHFRLGEIAERRGKPAEARAHFARVVALWSDADPEFQPWVTRARLRMSASPGTPKNPVRRAGFPSQPGGGPVR